MISATPIYLLTRLTRGAVVTARCVAVHMVVHRITRGQISLASCNFSTIVAVAANAAPVFQANPIGSAIVVAMLAVLICGQWRK